MTRIRRTPPAMTQLASSESSPLTPVTPNINAAPPKRRQPESGAASSRNVKARLPRQDVLNLHAMWFAPRWRCLTPSSNAAFRDALVEAFLELRAGSIAPKKNVGLHLWTDRANNLPFYYPLTIPGAGDVVMSQAVIKCESVAIHHAGDLEDLVDRESDPALREALKLLMDHPANANIGFRSDVTRLMYLLLYARQSEKSNTSVPPSQLNVHLDKDVLENLNRSSGAKLSMADRWDKADLTFAIGESLKALGFFSRSGENSAFAVMPGHPAGRKMAESMRRTVETGTYMPRKDDAQGAVIKSGSYLRFEKEVRRTAAFLAEITGCAAEKEALDTMSVVDHFRLAERIRQETPMIQYTMDRILERCADPLLRDAQRQRLLRRAAALDVIYRESGKLTVNYVNLNTFVPMVESASVPDLEMAGFFRRYVGALPSVSSTAKSWRVGELATGNVSLPHETVGPADLRDAFDHIKRAMVSQTDDDLRG